MTVVFFTLIGIMLAVALTWGAWYITKSLDELNNTIPSPKGICGYRNMCKNVNEHFCNPISNKYYIVCKHYEVRDDNTKI